MEYFHKSMINFGYVYMIDSFKTGGVHVCAIKLTAVLYYVIGLQDLHFHM